MLRALVIWVVVTLLVCVVGACPIANCPMMRISQSTDDCCNSAGHPSDCPQHQKSSDCPYQVIEKALASKISSPAVDAELTGLGADSAGARVEAADAVPVRELPQNGSGRYLRLCILLI